MVFRRGMPSKDTLESGREYCPFCGRDWQEFHIYTGVCPCGSTSGMRQIKRGELG